MFRVLVCLESRLSRLFLATVTLDCRGGDSAPDSEFSTLVVASTDSHSCLAIQQVIAVYVYRCVLL